jgi:hypothetical protein
LIGEWEETMPQITQEEKDKLSETVNRVETWLQDNVQAQEALTAFETPAFSSTEVLNQLKPLTVQLDKLLKKPKPVPPKVCSPLSSSNSSSLCSLCPYPHLPQLSNETNSTATVNATATDESSTGAADDKAEGADEKETSDSEPETIHINPEDLRDPSSIGDDEL